ncbi:unnamed protein product, partial [Choristocarpus tenellus]
MCAQLEDLLTPATAAVFSEWLGNFLIGVISSSPPTTKVSKKSDKVEPQGKDQQPSSGGDKSNLVAPLATVPPAVSSKVSGASSSKGQDERRRPVLSKVVVSERQRTERYSPRRGRSQSRDHDVGRDREWDRHRDSDWTMDHSGRWDRGRRRDRGRESSRERSRDIHRERRKGWDR